MSKFQKSSSMTCQQAELLMVPMWAEMPGITDEQMTAFNFHLIVCPACAAEYEQTGQMMSLVKEHWGPVSKETRQLIENAGYEVLQPGCNPVSSRSIAAEKRCKSYPEITEKSGRYKLFTRIAAVAACLIFGILAWMILPNNIAQRPLSHNFGSTEAESSFKIEMVKPAGNIAIDAGQVISADKELKTLLINGRHRMVINVGTSLSVEPVTANSQIGCLVKLDSGQIYTHVRNDGKPFIVSTAHGRAVITGTVFDITASKNSTTLVVAEGAVRFESEKGCVNVTAGQKSSILGRSGPSVPLACNAAELTAWATGYNSNTTLAQAAAGDIDWYLSLPFRPEPIILAETDYSMWVNEKRQWFESNFPWIFELKEALEAEGIEVDYPELLIESGDVWQFVCLKDLPGRFAAPDFGSLLKTATVYGFDKEWLLENVPIAKAIQNKSVISEDPSGLAAFDQLLNFVNGTETTPYYLYPADACKYLIETRSLIWFEIDAGRYKLTQPQRTEILDLLQQQIIAAANCSNVLLYPKDKKQTLCINVCETADMQMAGYMEAMKAIEKDVVILEVYNEKQKNEK